MKCPTKLYYKAQDFPENEQSIPFIKHAILNKRLLKSLVRSAYPQGKYIEGNSISQSAVLTAKYLQQDETVLFDAIFEHRQMMSRLPVLVKNHNELTAFHIQTKAFDSRKHRLVNSRGHLHSKWRTYLLGFAYQLFILKQNFPGFKLKPVLVLPDKKGLSHSNNLPFLLKPFEKNNPGVSSGDQDLLANIDVSEYISIIWNDGNFAGKYLPKPSFVDSLEFFRQTYFDQEKIPPEVGLKCKRCEFRIDKNRKEEGKESGFGQCWQPYQADKNHVFDLIGPGTNNFIRQKIYGQKNISNSDIFPVDDILEAGGGITQKMRQSLQILKAKGEKVPEEIIRPGLKKELQRWEYPLHFLDFEAGNYAVPVRSKRSPYHLIVFQFSCHTLFEDGSWSHHQWVDDFESGYVNYELIRQLKNVPQITEGTIVQYSNFERHALKVIRRELIGEREKVDDAEELIEWITEVIQRRDSSHRQAPFMADLSRQVKHFYYNREMENSLSIKDVLRSVMSHSQFLKQKYSKPYSSDNFDKMVWWKPDEKNSLINPYNLLTEKGAESIRRGTEAMVVYGELISRKPPAEELAAYQKSLLRYCELDTLAMVMIYQHWQHEVERL